MQIIRSMSLPGYEKKFHKMTEFPLEFGLPKAYLNYFCKFPTTFRKLFYSVLPYLNDVYVQNTQRSIAYQLFLFLIFWQRGSKNSTRITDTVVVILEQTFETFLLQDA